MSLRTRMVVAFALIASTLVVAGATLLALQGRYLVRQVDSRLTRQLGNAIAVVAGQAPGQATGQAPGQDGPLRGSRGLADMYVGILGDAGLQTVSTPESDPGLVPVLDGEVPPGTPTTVPADGGTAAHMRVAATTLPTGGTVVLGRSLTEVDEAMADLRTAMVILGVLLLLVVSMVFWWMRRLGLDPILRVTAAARAISMGDTSQRVEPFPPGTEAHDLGTAFNQLVETNEASRERLRQFVADVSHELRTPLVTLKGYAALHGSGGISDPQATTDAMRRIRQEANRMSRLVEDLLLLAEMDQGLPLTSAPVDLVPIVTDLAADLRVLDPDREITLQVPGSAVVTGDRDRLTQVLTALTGNALRHTPAGTGIDLRVRGSSAAVRIEVADHGPGITAEDLPRVFDRFYRADAARARASGGSGLGLAIAAAIVRAHGGSIGVDSPPGRGATFWVQLPTGRTGG